MKCGICGSEDTIIVYDDKIRNGALGVYTEENYQMYECKECGTIFHKLDAERSGEYYQSKEYRIDLEKTSDINDYYNNHDRDVLEKLEYTGTGIYRDKTVADIGCGGGSFLDFVSSVAKTIIAIEPSVEYRDSLTKKGYSTYSYATEALVDYEGKVDVITSYDVIEHVNNPVEFMTDVYRLLKLGGVGIIGTPTNCPVMRELLGHTYEQKLLFSYQHPWILSGNSFDLCCRKAGFTDVKVEYKQRYGLSNLIKWCAEKKPSGHSQMSFISSTMDECYKRELEQHNMADYIVAYVKK